MNKKATPRKFGKSIFILGFAMLAIGASLFTYQRPRLPPIISTIGQICFMFWLPVFIVGAIAMAKDK